MYVCEYMNSEGMCEYIHAGVTACGHVTCECEWMVHVRICMLSVCEQL